MRCMVLERNGPIEGSPLRFREMPDPHPGPGQVRIRVRYCAICRTDLHVIEADLPARTLPIIPGHQCLGEVNQVGAGCSRLKPGDRVGIAWLHSTCGRCSYCRLGKENLCPGSLFTGYDMHGGYAEYAIAREDFVYPIPAEIGDLSAAPLLCAGIIGYRALTRCRLPANGKLGIFGFGSSAHIIAQIAIARGAELFVVTRAQEHQELALSVGARWAGPSAEGLPSPLDGAILFAPAGDLVPRALESLDKGGTLAIAGIHLSPLPALDYHRHLFFEKDLRTVTANTREDGRALFEEVRSAPVRIHSRLYRLEEANQALLDLKSDRIQGTGILKI